MQSKRLAALAFLLAAASAQAEIVTITFAGDEGIPDEFQYFGTVSYDTTAQPTALIPYNGITGYQYTYTNFSMTVSIGGVSYTGPTVVEVASFPSNWQGPGEDTVFVYARLPGTDYLFELNFGWDGTGMLGSNQPPLASAYATAVPFAAGSVISVSANQYVWYSQANYSVSAVPEPSPWAMLLSGLGIAGVAVRRRRVDAHA